MLSGMVQNYTAVEGLMQLPNAPHKVDEEELEETTNSMRFDEPITTSMSNFRLPKKV
ncbi:unnamed protein product [Natator depressus]